MTDISNSEGEIAESQETTILNSGALSDDNLNSESEDLKAAPAMDQATLSVMVHALKAHEAASELNTEILEDICIEAFAAGKLNDTVWLGQKLKEVTGQDVEIDLSVGAEGEPTSDSASDYLEQIQISQTAMIETEEDMKEVLRLHEIWMNSVLRPRSDITGDRANLRGANLSGFNLAGVDLRCADFRNATLIGTNFHSAQLSNAWLQGASLQGANLTKANLKRAKLIGTDLRDADLTEVDMESTDFSKAILKGNAEISKVFVSAEAEVKFVDQDNAIEEKPADQEQCADLVANSQDQTVEANDIEPSELETSELETSELETSELETSELEAVDIEFSGIEINDVAEESDSSVNEEVPGTEPEISEDSDLLMASIDVSEELSAAGLVVAKDSDEIEKG